MRRIVRTGRRPRVRVVPRRVKRRPVASRTTAAPRTTANPPAETIRATAIDSPRPEPTISLTLVGPPAWREPLARWLEYESSLTLMAEIDPENRPPHVFDLPSADVVIVSVDSGDPDPSVELALELQAKDRGTGIILALSGLRHDIARRFAAYAGSWSLITSRTSSDPMKLTIVVQSSARGIPVVEPAVTKMLEAGWSTRATEATEAEATTEPDRAITGEAA